MAMYMGQDVGNAKDPTGCDTLTLAGQSEHVMAVEVRLIDGLNGASPDRRKRRRRRATCRLAR
eukprot:scaffold37223_cov326-Isochrysis_galbana.AAC.4